MKGAANVAAPTAPDLVLDVTQMKACGVYLLPDVLLLHAERRVKAGILYATEPVFILSRNASASEVGATLRRALAAHRAASTPTDWKSVRATFLQATGFRSWKAFESAARSCWIAQKFGRLKFTPLKNGGSIGPKSGFKPFGADQVVTRFLYSDEEAGSALLTALQRSQ